MTEFNKWVDEYRSLAAEIVTTQLCFPNEDALRVSYNRGLTPIQAINAELAT